MLTTTAPDGSAHGGQQALGRLGLLAPGGGSGAAPAAAAGPTVLDALFVETGFKQATALAEAQASLLQQLNASVSMKWRVSQLAGTTLQAPHAHATWVVRPAQVAAPLLAPARM